MGKLSTYQLDEIALEVVDELRRYEVAHYGYQWTYEAALLSLRIVATAQREALLEAMQQRGVIERHEIERDLWRVVEAKRV